MMYIDNRSTGENDGVPLFSANAHRFLVVLAFLVYALSFHLSHATYLVSAWEYLGFTYAPPSAIEYLFGFLMLAAVGLSLPVKLSSPGSIVVLVLAIMVFVPSVVITLGLTTAAADQYLFPLCALSAAFILICWTATLSEADSEIAGLPGRTMIYGLLVAWILCTVALVNVYSDRLRFVSLDDVYGQRQAGAATSALIAYTQTYYLNVFCPGLFAVGLIIKSKRWMLAPATLGFLLVYSITAQKMSLLVPVAMIAVYFAMTSPKQLLALTLTLSATVSLTIIFALISLSDGSESNWFAAILVHRMLAIPGLTLTQYIEFFDQNGHTLWSHVRFISSIIPPPDALIQNEHWPSLGMIVGNHVYGDKAVNLNANLFASDGYAAAGSLGIIIIGFVMAIWLAILNRCSRHWDRRFPALVLMPVAVSLANGPLFTVMLSFGGLFWTAVFLLSRPSRTRPIDSLFQQQRDEYEQAGKDAH